MSSIVQHIPHWAEVSGDKIALIADDEQLSYAELWRAVQGFASYLDDCGFPHGTNIIVKAAPSLWYAIAVLGIHLAGHVNVPQEKTIGPEALKERVSLLDAAMVIGDTDPGNAAHYVSPEQVRSLAAAHPPKDLPMPQDDDLCDILFTTGTTGKSKGVMLSHRAVFAASDNIVYSNQITPDVVYLLPAPLNHAGAIRKFYASMICGATAVFLDGISNLRNFYRYLADYRVTNIFLPPVAVRMLLLLSAKELAKYADQVRCVHTDSAAFPEPDKEKLCEILPRSKLIFGYGSSEAGTSTAYDYEAFPGKQSCIGKVNRNAHVFIVDEARREIASSPSALGTIAISGPTVMKGYYHEPELTAGVLKDGVIYTNDVGYIDDEGFVYMIGRQDDVINVGGLKIAPTEVESVVLRFPGVAECACFGIDDKNNGTVPKLLLVTKDKQPLDLKELRSFMSSYLENYKIPTKIEYTDEIPKTSNGKIARKLLK